MLKHTVALYKKTIEEIKLFVHLMTVLVAVVMTCYLLVSCFIGVGEIAPNIVLAVLTALNLGAYLVAREKQEKAARDVSRRVKRVYKVTKLLFNALSLGAVIYTAVTTPEEVTSLQLIITPLLIILWVVSFAAEVISIYLERKLYLFEEALRQDIEDVLRPVTAVKSFVGGIFERRKADPETDGCVAAIDAPSDSSPSENDTECAERGSGISSVISRGRTLVKSVFKKRERKSTEAISDDTSCEEESTVDCTSGIDEDGR